MKNTSVNDASKDYEILGFGSACVDLLYRVNDDFLNLLDIKKGDGQSVDWKKFSSVLEKCAKNRFKTQLTAGGSASNTIRGLASLNNSTAFYGTIGNDSLGTFLLENLASKHVYPLLSVANVPTSQIAVFVTEDHQRSFLSFAGANLHMVDAELSSFEFEDVRLVHIEGYMIDELPLPYIEKIMQLAKKSGSTISLDMGCPRIAKTHTKNILRLLENYVDIVFANQDEVKALLDLPPDQGSIVLGKLCNTAAVGVGKDGSWVASDKEAFHSPATKVKPIDSTGAGDLFASGFLHGYLQGWQLSDCAWLGNLLGGIAVTVTGAEIPAEKWPEIKAKIEQRKGLKAAKI